MKLVVARQGLRRALKHLQRALFAASALMFAYCAFVLVDSWMFQRRASLELERRRRDELVSRQAESRSVPHLPPAVAPDGLIGRIEIGRLDLSAIVFEGTTRETLRRAVGHIAGTALPGQRGNVGLAGHRDTFFRPLKDVRRHDLIALTTAGGEYRYRVVSTRVVLPTDVWVLNRSENEVLTLVTCYPFYFVGSAPNRFIVRADRVEERVSVLDR